MTHESSLTSVWLARSSFARAKRTAGPGKMLLEKVAAILGRGRLLFRVKESDQPSGKQADQADHQGKQLKLAHKYHSLSTRPPVGAGVCKQEVQSSRGKTSRQSV